MQVNNVLPETLGARCFKNSDKGKYTAYALCYKVSSAGSPGIKHIIISVAVVFESANQGGQIKVK